MNVLDQIRHESIKCEAQGLPRPDGFVLGLEEQQQVSAMLGFGVWFECKKSPADGLMLLGFKAHFSYEPSRCTPIWNKLAYEI